MGEVASNPSKTSDSKCSDQLESDGRLVDSRSDINGKIVCVRFKKKTFLLTARHSVPDEAPAGQ